MNSIHSSIINRQYILTEVTESDTVYITTLRTTYVVSLVMNDVPV